MNASPALGRGIFVSNARFLDGRGGGVQLCTQEYLHTLRAAGLDVETLALSNRARFMQRLAYRIVPNPYTLAMNRAELAKLAVAAQDADFVFLNQVSLIGNGRAVRRAIGERPKIVLLSHGCEITDLLLGIRARRQGLPLSLRSGLSTRWTLGSVLHAEMRSRAFIDGVITLSPFDQAMEDWYGVPSAVWVPRVITPAALPWKPVENRFGYVGTLDHAPNLEGLVRVAAALAKTSSVARIEVIGGPAPIGSWLQGRYPHINYLGSLNREALAARAATWAAFLHPIFHIARGCSTKLAEPIAWGMPVITTPQGRRGYQWRRGSLVECADPAGFVAAMTSLDRPTMEMASCNVAAVRDSSPGIAEVGKTIRSFLHKLNPHLDQPPQVRDR